MLSSFNGTLYIAQSWVINCFLLIASSLQTSFCVDLNILMEIIYAICAYVHLMFSHRTTLCRLPLNLTDLTDTMQVIYNFLLYTYNFYMAVLVTAIPYSVRSIYFPNFTSRCVHFDLAHLTEGTSIGFCCEIISGSLHRYQGIPSFLIGWTGTNPPTKNITSGVSIG